jgi:hypothetical protein
VVDTLIMVKNIESSLKRLKKSRKTSQNEEMSDDDKIRSQIQLDVEAYGQEVSLPLGFIGVAQETWRYRVSSMD